MVYFRVRHSSGGWSFSGSLRPDLCAGASGCLHRRSLVETRSFRSALRGTRLLCLLRWDRGGEGEAIVSGEEEDSCNHSGEHVSVIFGSFFLK